MRQRPVVAIDGPAGVGKSTVARRLASALDFVLIDTGALYRAVALLADDVGVDWGAGQELAKIAANHLFSFDESGLLSVDGVPVEDRIRSPRISEGASAVARHPEVRGELVKIQRSLGRSGGVVMEGRDIGTVVFPDAEVKFFLTASSKTRAKRRYRELRARGEKVDLSEVEREQERRDRADRSRPHSPLRRAEDAKEIQCDEMNIEKVTETLIDSIRASFPLTSK